MTQPMDPVAAQFNHVQQQIASLQAQIVKANQVAMGSRAELELMRRGRSPRRAVEFRSQFGEDVLAWKLLGEPLEGFFIEVGAFDGYHYSVTYALEAMGWNGLLVEALPKPYEACVARRPNSRVVHAALSKRGSSGETTFHSVQDHYGGMLSYLDPASDHAKAVQAAKRDEIKVPFTTMNDLLADHTGEIDLALIDVEGGELDLLDGFDLNRYRPRLLIIEDNSGGRDPRLRRYMADFPYELAGAIAVNDVFIRKDETEMLRRRQWI